MAEEERIQNRQKSDSYPSPRSHPSPSTESLHMSTQEQGQEEEQEKEKMSRPLIQDKQISVSTPLNLPPSDNADNLNHQQNGLRVSPQHEEHQQQQGREREQHELPQTQQREHQQDAQQSSVIATTPAILTATQSKLNTQPNGSALPMNAYFSQAGSSPGSQMTVSQSSQSTALRYPIASQSGDERIIAGARNRKEIKRRTKTGCLTCRKRRIKHLYITCNGLGQIIKRDAERKRAKIARSQCDENHPACRNCQKSKRECLGYDPIFKQQPGPPQIQPAPSIVISTSGSPTVTVSSSTYPNIPHVYLSANSNSSHPSDPTVDPIPPIVQQSPSAITQPVYDISHPLQADMNQTTTATNGHRPPSIPDKQVVEAKTVPIDELFSIDGTEIAPPISNTQVEPTIMNEIKLLFIKDYAPGLDRFLESSWYSTKGLTLLLSHTKICEMFADLIKRFRTINSNDYDGMQQIASMEARMVWNLVTLPRLSPSSPLTETDGSTAPKAMDEQLSNVKRRLSTLEALLTNNILDANPIFEADGPPSIPPANSYEIEFWRNLGLFTAISETSPDSNKQTENALNSMRNVLGQLENRDVLYSIAIARYYGLRVAEFPGGMQQAFSADDSDRHTKLFIAKHFVEQEANGKGTTQVIQRFCGMAVRSWSAIRV